MPAQTRSRPPLGRIVSGTAKPDDHVGDTGAGEHVLAGAADDRRRMPGRSGRRGRASPPTPGRAKPLPAPRSEDNEGSAAAHLPGPPRSPPLSRRGRGHARAPASSGPLPARPPRRARVADPRRAAGQPLVALGGLLALGGLGLFVALLVGLAGRLRGMGLSLVAVGVGAFGQPFAFQLPDERAPCDQAPPRWRSRPRRRQRSRRSRQRTSLLLVFASWLSTQRQYPSSVLPQGAGAETTAGPLARWFGLGILSVRSRGRTELERRNP